VKNASKFIPTATSQISFTVDGKFKDSYTFATTKLDIKVVENPKNETNVATFD
jgi:hypothetical protein